MSANDLSLDKQWYLLKGREVLGPYAGHAIRDMVRDRRVGPDAMVALPGSADWQPISVLAGSAGPGPGAPPLAPGAVMSGRHYAGFWIRVAAYLLDSLIVAVPLYILIYTPLILSGALTQDSIAVVGNLIGLLIGLVFVFYSAFFTAGRRQATPGKRICNIHVIHEAGGPIGFGRAIGRAFAYWLDAIILYIGFMMAGWTREKTALHDMICQTRVVYGRVG